MTHRLYRNVEASQFQGQRYPPAPVTRNDPRLLAAISFTISEKQRDFDLLANRKIDALGEPEVIEKLRNLYADICDLMQLRVSLLTDGQEKLLFNLPRYRPTVVTHRGVYEHLMLMQL